MKRRIHIAYLNPQGNTEYEDVGEPKEYSRFEEYVKQTVKDAGVLVGFDGLVWIPYHRITRIWWW